MAAQMAVVRPLTVTEGRLDPAVLIELAGAAYRDHSARLYGRTLRSTRDPELAAEVTQDAFLHLVGEAQAGRFPENVAAWLYRTSRNLVISRARRTAVARRAIPRLMPLDRPAEPDAIALMQERNDELRTALDTLLPAQRLALILASRGATGEEMSSQLGRSPSATRTLLCRARQNLRAIASTAESEADRAYAKTR